MGIKLFAIFDYVKIHKDVSLDELPWDLKFLNA